MTEQILQVEPLTWKNEKRKLRELMAWQFNPRQITEEEGRRLLESLTEFGQFQTIAITPDGIIVDGHQRNFVWAASDKYGPDFEVDVRVASRLLTDKERAKLAVLAHKGATGEWDWDKLANMPDVDVPDLVEWGFKEEELLGAGVLQPGPPEDFTVVDETLPVDFQCPKCGYKWSGQAAPVRTDNADSA